VKEVEKGESGAGFDGFLRGRIETAAKELNVMWNGASAATILDGDLMDPVGVDDEQGGVRSSWDFAVHTGVVELYFEADGFERHLHESRTRPFLQRVRLSYK